MKENKVKHNRKGFSLVELVIVILVIAVLALAVFAGGSVVVKKSQVSRTVSDLHNFSIAVEAALNETPAVANYTANTGSFATLADGVVAALNNNLAEDYRLETAVAVGSQITFTQATDGGNYQIFQSKKTDSWGNHYFVIFDSAERHGTDNSDFYITVISAGPNAKLTMGSNNGNINEDDIFLLGQYEDGDVAAVTYNVAADNFSVCSTANSDLSNDVLTSKNTVADRVGCTWGAGATTAPVNF